VQCTPYQAKVETHEGIHKGERCGKVCGDLIMMIGIIDKIELPDEIKSRSFNELQTLDNLWKGMCFIYKLVRELERKTNEKICDGTVLQNIPPEARKGLEGKDIKYVSCGNDPFLSWIDKGLLYSLFQWYAISACNYVRLLGYLIKLAKPENQTPNKYVEKVIPEVKWFRDKIAAHHSRASDDKRDNEADRIASVYYQVGFNGERFHAPSWWITTSYKGEKITSTNKSSWSITETHEKIASVAWEKE
jgi:hypothetical protein